MRLDGTPSPGIITLLMPFHDPSLLIHEPQSRSRGRGGSERKPHSHSKRNISISFKASVTSGNSRVGLKSCVYFR